MLANLASLWQNLTGLNSSPKPKTQIVKDTSLALAPIQFAIPNVPGKFHTANLWMMKSDAGWKLVPEKTIMTISDAKLRRSVTDLEKKIIAMTQAQRNEISKQLLSQVFTIDPANIKAAVTERNATELIKQYRSHLRSDDHQSALNCCAILKGTDDTKTLKNLNYALKGVDDHIKDDRTLGFTSAGNWSGVSVRTQSKLAGTHDYPLYLCLQTEKGPKVLLDIDLRYASNNGRKALNKINWDKLEKAIPADAFKNVQTIFSQHQKLVTKDIEAEKKLHE